MKSEYLMLKNIPFIRENFDGEIVRTIVYSVQDTLSQENIDSNITKIKELASKSFNCDPSQIEVKVKKIITTK